MALTAYALTITLHDETGDPQQDLVVTATLISAKTGRQTSDYTTGGAFIPVIASATTNASGVATIDLVSNLDGQKDTAYEITTADANGRVLLHEQIQMPQAAANLEDLIGAVTIPSAADLVAGVGTVVGTGSGGPSVDLNYTSNLTTNNNVDLENDLIAYYDASAGAMRVTAAENVGGADLTALETNIGWTADSTYDVGTSSVRPATVYADNFNASGVTSQFGGMEVFSSYSRITLSNTNLRIALGIPIQFSNIAGTAAFNSAPTDLRYGGEDGVIGLGMTSDATAGGVDIYESFTDASNYGRFGIRWSGSRWEVGDAKDGTGSNRDIRLRSRNVLTLLGDTRIDVGNSLRPTTDSAFTLGTDSQRWSTVYADELDAPRLFSTAGAVDVDGGDSQESVYLSLGRFAFTQSGMRIRSVLPMGWVSTGDADDGTLDLTLYRDAADTLALRRDANAQRLNVYGIYTDASNYSGGSIAHDGSTFVIDSWGAGSGSAGGVDLRRGGSTRLVLRASDTQSYVDLVPLSSNSVSLGGSSNYWAEGYISRVIGNAGAITLDRPLIDMSATWNNGALTMEGWKLDITDTASAAASFLMDLRVDGSSVFEVGKDGSLTLATGAALISNGTQLLADTTGQWEVAVGGASRVAFGNSFVTVNDSGYLGFTSTFDAGITANVDTSLYRDDVGTLALRSGTTAQTSNVYGSYTDASNYERFRAAYIAGTGAYLYAEGAGTGANGVMVFNGFSNQGVRVSAAGNQVEVLGNGGGRIGTIDMSGTSFEVGTTSNTDVVLVANGTTYLQLQSNSSEIDVGADKFFRAHHNTTTVDFQKRGQTSDLATNPLTFQGSDAFASATTNQDGGDIVLRPGAAASGGGDEGEVQLQMADGTIIVAFNRLSSAALSFPSGNRGIDGAGTRIPFSIAGTTRGLLRTEGWQAAQDRYFTWSSSTDAAFTPDLRLGRDASGTLSIYGGTTRGADPAGINAYGSYTDASNYERLAIGYDSGNTRYQVIPEATGTGVQRSLRLGGAGIDLFPAANTGTSIRAFGTGEEVSIWNGTTKYHVFEVNDFYPNQTGANLGTSSDGWSTFWLSERSSDPADPSTGNSVMWISDGTGFGSRGDLCYKSNDGTDTREQVIAAHASGTVT